MLIFCLDGVLQWLNGTIAVYDKARKIEGAAQRVQEDTIKVFTYYGVTGYKFN